jgi:hypothetical protein
MGQIDILSERGVLVASTPGDNEANVVNARLIAAAPELLEALKWCVRHLEQIAERDWEDSTPDARRFNSTKNALLAIAKATGGAE